MQRPHLKTIEKTIVKTIKTFGTSLCLVVLSACANNDNPCEEILEVKQQHQDCERLRKTMMKTNYPQQALTAKLQYEEACLNLRYYRDEFDTICKRNETPIGQKPKEN